MSSAWPSNTSNAAIGRQHRVTTGNPGRIWCVPSFWPHRHSADRTRVFDTGPIISVGQSALGIKQHGWLPRRMQVVEGHPSVMMLTGIRLLAHVEPLDATGKHQHPANGAAVMTSATRSAALHCKFTLHCGGKGQRVPQELQQCPR